MPSDVLARTCAVSTRKEEPKKGFQRTLDEKRAADIARYIENGGTIPNSIVLSAQSAADLKIIGGSKTVEFSDKPGAFLILDGQHRVYGFSKTKKTVRVPVVLYNNLTRKDETLLFIDINTKQRPVPAQLLLDIKRLAEIEDESEAMLREIFDAFHKTLGSALLGLMAPFETEKNKITRVTFNAAVKPLLELFAGRQTKEIYDILNSYLHAASTLLKKKSTETIVCKPVVFRSLIGLFPFVAQRVQDKFSGDYSSSNFSEILSIAFANVPAKKFEQAGTSWTTLRDYLEKRLRSKLTL